MDNNELRDLKRKIELLRDEINTYIQYPEIFNEELIESSARIDALINEYMSNVKK